MSSLFTEVPLDETIDHIIHEIYTNNKLRQLSSKLLFRRLLCNVTKYTVFSFNNKLYKQIDGCGMGNPLSPVIASIFMAKLEADVVQPFNPPSYDRYVDDCFSKKKDEPDALFERLNHYHPNIFFTVEETPTTSSILPLIILPSSIAASSRNRENYQHVGNLRSLPSGKEIASLARSIELNVTSTDYDKDFFYQCRLSKTFYFAYNQQLSRRLVTR